MKLSVEWVNHFLTKPLKAKPMAEAMELAGIEVEEIVLAQPLDDKIIVGKILEVSPHPNADKLKITKVDVKNSTLSIVCGAPNVAEGMYVAVATVGSVLPDGTKIKAAKLRDEESQGMLCSEQELGIGQSHEGLLSLDSVTAVIGQKVNEIIGVDDAIDVKTAANRWDLNSVLGVAREVAAQTKQKLSQEYPEQLESSSKGELNAIVAQPGLATRYMLVLLSVDQGTPSPQWLQKRLQAQGVRSISPVVDVTNYIMLEYGQPLHAFDASKVEGQVQVRRARKGEKLTTLDGVERTLVADDIVIADDSQAIGLAGVMGGAATEIDDATTEIILEAASFHPASLRKTAIRYGLRTDASARFERTIPVDLPPRALNAARELLEEIACAKLVAGPADARHQTGDNRPIAASIKGVNRLLGLSLTARQITDHLQKLSFIVEAGASLDELNILAPWWRPDVTHQADLAEEVIKMVGYEQLPATIPALRARTAHFDTRWAPLWRAKNVLRSLGWFEVSTYSFIAAHQIEDLSWKTDMHLKLKNPLSSEQAYLRRSLLPSLLAAASRNRTYGRSFGMFEISKTFWKTQDGKLPEEPTFLAALTVSPDDGYRLVKAALDRILREFNVVIQIEPAPFHPVVAHPTRSAILKSKGEQVGVVGQLHPAVARRYKLVGEVGFLELNWPRIMGLSRPVVARPLPKYPTASRDISMRIDRSVSWVQVEELLAGFNPKFLNDYYGGDLPSDKKSLALRLTFHSDDHTLTDNEVDRQLAQVAAILVKNLHAELR
jgi:phenylalanyl-tRNA synthetase beta chain